MNIFFKEYGGLILGIVSVILSLSMFMEVIPSLSNIVNTGVECVFGEGNK